MMVWNGERVELLTKLWAEGLSASTIAGRLGGVTRNAVIGKVHRLGLPGRVTTSRTRAATAQNTGCRVARPRRERPASPRVWTVRGALALKPDRRPAAPPKPRLAIVLRPDEAIESAPGVALFQLDEHMCRWPKGDPKDTGFHFCGRRKADGLVLLRLSRQDCIQALGAP